MNKFQNLISKKWILALICISAFSIGFLASALGSTLYTNLSQNKQTQNTAKNFTNATPAPINNNTKQTGVYNALLLGYGGGNHAGADLTDSIIVIHVDTNTKKADLISVPRDLWIPGNQKINAVANTGFKNVGPAITGVTGLPINYFVAINFDDFTKLVDNLGGITITMPNTLDDAFYPILGQEDNTCGFSADQINTFKNQYSGFDLEKQFTCRYEHLQYKAGQVVNLDGATALKIARSRHGDSDFARSLRQFAELQGIANKLITLRSMNKIDQTVSTLFNMVNTDLDLGTIKSLSEVFTGDYKINQIQLTTDNVLNQGTASDGEFILYPKTGMFDFSSVKNYINQNL